MERRLAIDGVETVPLWSSSAGEVVRVAPDALQGESLLCVIRNLIGLARQTTVARESIAVGTGGTLRNKDGRQILAFLASLDDATACIKAFPPVTDDSFSAVGQTIGGQKQLATRGVVVTDVQVDPKMVLARLERNWFNCGRAASSLQDDLENLGAELDRTTTTYRADDFAAFLSLPGRQDDVPVLIDVTVMGAHTFTIEMQSTNCFYLVQGYQGAYSAFWWQGLADRPQDLSLPADAGESAIERARELLEPTRRLRSILGLGQALNLDTLGTEVLIPLRAFMRTQVWGEAAYDAWTRLPFYTNEARINLPQPRSVAEPIELTVKVVRILNWQTLYLTLGAERPASICGLIVARALVEYEQFLKLAKG